MLIAETRFRYFRSSDLQIDLALLFREETYDRLRGRHLGIEVKMRVNVARRGNVAVTEPLLNILERHAVCIKQGRAGMTQIVETYAAHLVIFKKRRERLRQIAGLHTFAQRIDVDIILVIVVVAIPAEFLIQILLLLHKMQKLFKRRHQRQTTVRRLRLCAILFNYRAFPVDTRLRDRVTNRDRFVIKVDIRLFLADVLLP